MDTLSYKTVSVNKETAQKEWVIVDATDQVVGRLCSKVAKLIRGKYKPTFTPSLLMLTAATMLLSSMPRRLSSLARRRLTNSTPVTQVILVVSVSTLLHSCVCARAVLTRSSVML